MAEMTNNLKTGKAGRRTGRARAHSRHQAGQLARELREHERPQSGRHVDRRALDRA